MRRRPTRSAGIGRFGERLIFPVVVVVQEKLKGTSLPTGFTIPSEPFVGEVSLTWYLMNRYCIYPIAQRPISMCGISAVPGLKRANVHLEAENRCHLSRVEWLIGDEWSSGTDWFKDPCLRFASSQQGRYPSWV